MIKPLHTEDAVELAAAILLVIPTTVRAHASALEGCLLELVLSGRLRRRALQLVGLCLSLLPRAQGDAATWSSSIRRLLVSIHQALDLMFMGLEPPPPDSRYRETLMTGPGGEVGLLADLASSLSPPDRNFPRLLGVLRCMMDTLESFVVQGYPSPVPLPSYSIIMVINRILQVDLNRALAAGAVPHSSLMFLELVRVLPELQGTAWKLLQALIGVAQSQMVPYYGLLFRLIKDHLRDISSAGPSRLSCTAGTSVVRKQVYCTCGVLLRASGAAVHQGLVGEVVSAVAVELYGQTLTASGSGQGEPGTQEVSGPTRKRARTRGGLSSNDVVLGGYDPSAAIQTLASTPSSDLDCELEQLEVQESAVKLLDDMLVVVGPQLSHETRAATDAVLLHLAATTTAASARINADPLAMVPTCVAGLKRLQAATLSALLTSVLSPCGSRAPYLAQAMNIFRANLRDTSPEVRAVSQGAALACEPLLHPRSTPLAPTWKESSPVELAPLGRPKMWWWGTPEMVPKDVEPQHLQGARTAGGPSHDHGYPNNQKQDDKMARGAINGDAPVGHRQPAGQDASVDDTQTAWRMVLGQISHQQQMLQDLQVKVATLSGSGPAAGVPHQLLSGISDGGVSVGGDEAVREDAIMTEVLVPEAVPGPQEPGEPLTDHLVMSEPCPSGPPLGQLPSAPGWQPPPDSGETGGQASGPAHSLVTSLLATQSKEVGASGAGGWGVAAPLMREESSDSEGPLPEIDSGTEEEEEEEEA